MTIPGPRHPPGDRRKTGLSPPDRETAVTVIVNPVTSTDRDRRPLLAATGRDDSSADYRAGGVAGLVPLEPPSLVFANLETRRVVGRSAASWIRSEVALWHELGCAAGDTAEPPSCLPITRVVPASKHLAQKGWRDCARPA